MRLIFYRGLAGAVLAVVVALWFYTPAPPFMRQLMLIDAGAFLLLWVAQWSLRYSQVSERTQWTFQFLTDAVIAGVLIFATGGFQSPFAFILGLIIIASGTLAYNLLPLGTTVLVCSCYLTAVYGETWYSSGSLPNTQQSLHVLLQVSAWMLVGGVMGFISRRHAALRASSEAVAQQHKQLKDLHLKVLGTMREGVIVLNDKLEVSDMNEAARQILGLNVKHVLNTITSLREFLYNPGSKTFQCEYKHGEQALLVAATRLSEEAGAAWLLTLVDISEIRELEKKLVQQEKMAVLGQLAAQLAHEIRNPIHTMAQGLELLSNDGVKRVNVQAILHDEMLRLNRLVTTMLDYSRPLKPKPVPVSMRELLLAATNQINLAEREDVRWQCDERMMEVDVDHFRLLLDNLLTNALSNRPADTAVEIGLEAKESSWVLRLCNDGEISEAVKQKLFEPFVSGRSRGVGLGLATVKHVCEANGWWIEVKSAEGRTCFTVTGPLKSVEVEVLQEDEGMEQVNG